MNTQADNVSVFISHSSVDKLFAKRLAQDLEANDISTWVDAAEIRPGDDLILEIENGLKKASHVLIVLSTHSLLSSWVREEINVAQIQAIQGSIKLIPLLIGAITNDDIPLLLKSKHYLDFRDPSSYAVKFEELLKVFTVNGKKKKPASNILLPVIEDINILTSASTSEYALEILLNNPSPEKIFFKRVVIGARWCVQVRSGGIEPLTYEFNLNILPSSSKDYAIIRGTSTEREDEWGRPVSGYCYAVEMALHLKWRLLSSVNFCHLNAA